MPSSAVRDQRARVIDDAKLTGAALCTRLSDVTDELVTGIYESAVLTVGQARRKGSAALIAVGGYGRGELAPQSDIDLLLLHDRRASGVDELAREVWYPLWDAGLKLGHAVRSFDDQLALADDDLDTATALLSTRFLAGDEELADRITTESLGRWRRHGKRWLDELRTRSTARHSSAGEVAYLLEPDLKDGWGGLRDVHTLRWAAAADLLVPPEDVVMLDECYATLTAARVELHRATGRPGDVLRLELQDTVAAAGAFADADALMSSIAAAGRSIMWMVDDAWRRSHRHQRVGAQHIAPGVALVDGVVEIIDATAPSTDPVLPLRLARAAAEHDAGIGRSSLDRLVGNVDADQWGRDWPAGALDELVALLLQGHRAIDAMEALDQRGLLVQLLPEWERVRSRPQRNAYHRFTVDRHLWEAAANAAALVDRVDRPDLLVLGAWFHDIGKGWPGDHTEVGMELVAEIGPRLGIAPADVDTIVRLVEHHLLLPDVAVRRDLGDPATIRRVADAVGDEDTLSLLHALTEADSLATGPSAWGSWKEQLVAELVERTRAVLRGDGDRAVAAARFPDDATLATMAAGRHDVRVDHDASDDTGTERVTIVSPDLPGTFARAAGVLSLRGLDVLTAWAHSADVGAGPMAASQFRVTVPRGGIEWEPVLDDLRRGVAGELAIEARLAERATAYRRRRRTQAAPAGPPAVVFADAESEESTVIEVRAPDSVGVLHRIAKALADVGLDIRHATVQTMGEEVVDTFYVRTAIGRRVTDHLHRAEIERAVLYAVRK